MDIVVSKMLLFPVVYSWGMMIVEQNLLQD